VVKVWIRLIIFGRLIKWH